MYASLDAQLVLKELGILLAEDTHSAPIAEGVELQRGAERARGPTPVPRQIECDR